MLKGATVCVGVVTIGGAAKVTTAMGAATIDGTATDDVRDCPRSPRDALSSAVVAA